MITQKGAACVAAPFWAFLRRYPKKVVFKNIFLLYYGYYRIKFVTLRRYKPKTIIITHKHIIK